jgi:hypothetical protein
LCQDAQRLEIADNRKHQRPSLRRAFPFEKEGAHGGFVQFWQGHSLNHLLEAAHESHNGHAISDMRCIKPGWYAMDDVGNLSSGPFSSHAECFDSIIQPADEPLQNHP